MSSFSILLIENQIAATAGISQAIGQHLADYKLSIVRDIDEAVSEHAEANVILLNTTQFSGDVTRALSLLAAAYPDAPIILLHETTTPDETADEKILLEALASGANDYVSISEAGLLILGRRLTALYYTLRDETSGDEPEPDLSFSELLNKALAGDDSQLAVQFIGSDNRVRAWNRTAEAFFGVKPEEAVGLLVEDLPMSARNLSRLKDILDQAQVSDEPFFISSYPLDNLENEPRWVRVYVYPIRKYRSGSADKTIEVCIVSADLTDLKQVETEHWHHNQELEILLETSRAISSQLELQPTLEQIVEQAKSLFNAANCHIYLLEKDNRTLHPILSIGPQAGHVQNKTLTVGQGVVGSVAAKGKAVIRNSSDSDLNASFSQEEHLMCAPLTAPKGVIGAIVVTRSLKSPFTEDDLHFFENLVHQASAAINNARLFEETQRNLNELEILYEASGAISTTWDIQQVLNALIRHMVEALNVNRGHIVSWSKDQKSGTIRAEYISGEAISEPRESNLDLTFNLTKRPVLAIVTNQQRPVFFQLSNPALDESEREDMAKHGCLSRLLVPLIVKGETIGWAELWETREEHLFTTNEIRLVRMLASQAAVALENAQYLKKTQRTLEETTALYQVTSALASTQDSQSIISIVLQEYLQVLGLKQGSVIVFDFEAKAGIIKLHFHDDQPAISLGDAEGASGYIHSGSEGRQIPLRNNAVYRQLMRTHRPVIIENAQAEQSMISTPTITDQSTGNEGGWAGPTALSILIVPLQIRGEIIGAIVAEDTRYERTFDQWEISLGQAMADQLGIALQNARLYESEYERRRQAETLREVSFVVGSSLNLNEVLERILDQLGRVVKYDSAAIHLIEGHQRRIIAGRGFPNPKQVIGLTFPTNSNGNEPGAIVIQTRQPIVNGNISEHFSLFRQPERSYIKSWMGIPLIARDRVIGLISIDHSQIDAYGEEDVHLAMAFANQVAIALENARLHEIEVRELERELEIAHGIQRALLPQFVPRIPGLQIFGRSIPARQIGGDFFHFFSIGEDQLGVAIGDVSGKGIPAALYMAAAITAIDTKIADNLTPVELLNHLNQALYNRLQENKMNIGLQIATFAPFTSREDGNGKRDREAQGSLMTVASGGMIAPIGATKHGCRFLPVSGLPVGSFSPEPIYREDTFLLDPFTTIIFTSDGIVEAQNEYGELFGFDRLENTINEIVHARDAQIIADHIIHNTQSFMGHAEQGDDMTVVVVVKT